MYINMLLTFILPIPKNRLFLSAFKADPDIYRQGTSLDYGKTREHT